MIRLYDRIAGKLFYRAVACESCGERVGYVWWRGHRAWLCASCSPDRRPKAVGA